MFLKQGISAISIIQSDISAFNQECQFANVFNTDGYQGFFYLLVDWLKLTIVCQHLLIPQLNGGQPTFVAQQAFQVPNFGTVKHFRPNTGIRTHHFPPPARKQGAQKDA